VEAMSAAESVEIASASAEMNVIYHPIYGNLIGNMIF